MSERWDYAGQKADTEWMWRQLKNRQAAEPNEPITLDIQFYGARARVDPQAFAAALRRAGFEAHAYKQDGEQVVEATAPEAEFSLDCIWYFEKRATGIALKFGFEPEGWGFIEARGV